jgi:RNA polymerase sigma-70 factor, ECF subfamily
MQAHNITGLLLSWHRGDDAALDALVPLLYDELCAMAHRRLQRERYGQTLETGALVHEAFLRLVDADQVEWQSRAHFLAVAANVMRRVVVDFARRRSAAKRGGGAPLVALEDGDPRLPALYLDAVSDLDEALSKLSSVNERAASAIEQRYFGGLSLEETAEVLGVSLATAKRDVRFAQAWLARELGERAPEPQDR